MLISAFLSSISGVGGRRSGREEELEGDYTLPPCDKYCDNWSYGRHLHPRVCRRTTLLERSTDEIGRNSPGRSPAA